MSRDWISVETPRKEHDFRGLLGGIHLPICEGIAGRRGRATDPPYLFVDLHGGPGELHHDSVGDFLGSPLIALELLAGRGIRYETLHFEQDAATAVQLREAIARRDARHSTVIPSRFQDGMADWLISHRPHPWRYGLVYSDPIKDPIPVETFNRVAAHSPRIDLLAYVAANDQYKRANGGGANRPRLAQDIGAVHKKYALIRRPATAHEWTFILWTNWSDFPEWKRRDFHSLTSGTGRDILERINLTKAERFERENVELPFEELPPYSTYAEYLRHPRFLAVRAQVFERAAGVCERCGLRPPTEPHHLRYPPWGTFDVAENMIAICHPCHCEIHGKVS